MITTIRCAGALLALALTWSATRGAIRGTVHPEITIVAYTVAAALTLCVWGVGRIYRRSTP